MNKSLCSLLFVLIVFNLSAQSISKTEQQIVTNVGTDMSATMQLLKESVVFLMSPTILIAWMDWEHRVKDLMHREK